MGQGRAAETSGRPSDRKAGNGQDVSAQPVEQTGEAGASDLSGATDGTAGGAGPRDAAGEGTEAPALSARAQRDARLRQALRANLQRRKAQTRARRVENDA